MTGFASQFLAGLLAPFVGALMIANRRALLRLALIPFGITVLVLTIGLAFGLPFITGLVSPFTRQLLAILNIKPTEDVGLWLVWIFPFLIWPALALALVFLLLNLTRLVAAPFYGLLAEKVLRAGGALQDPPKGIGLWLISNIKQVQASLVKALLFMMLGLILALTSFIPGVGLATSFILLVLLAYDVFDYSLESLGWPVHRRFEFFRHNPGLFIGLGLSLGFVFLIPGLNFFVLPASVCGASDVVRRMIRE